MPFRGTSRVSWVGSLIGIAARLAAEIRTFGSARLLGLSVLLDVDALSYGERVLLDFHSVEDLVVHPPTPRELRKRVRDHDVVRTLHLPVPTPVRQSYSLLRAMLATAVADEVILRNPCAIKGAGVSRAVERPVATIPQVLALADAVPAHYRPNATGT
jgi:hypothetical protein